jgi:hypothetical protein
MIMLRYVEPKMLGSWEQTGQAWFKPAFEDAARREGLAGRIVLTVACFGLDRLHFRKIDLADEILVLNVDGYIGHSTRREIVYAMGSGKRVRFLDERLGDAYLEANAWEMGAMVPSLAQELLSGS